MKDIGSLSVKVSDLTYNRSELGVATAHSFMSEEYLEGPNSLQLEMPLLKP